MTHDQKCVDERHHRGGERGPGGQDPMSICSLLIPFNVDLSCKRDQGGV